MWNDELDRQEARAYHAGQKVELKNQPGVFATIAEYDPMMVPPIWLVNDPKPHYPEELKLVKSSARNLSWSRPVERLTSGWRTQPVRFMGGGDRAALTQHDSLAR